MQMKFLCIKKYNNIYTLKEYLISESMYRLCRRGAIQKRESTSWEIPLLLMCEIEIVNSFML